MEKLTEKFKTQIDELKLSTAKEITLLCDEANATIGIARSISVSEQTLTILLEIQKDLYQIMAEIAASPENTSKFKKITFERVEWIESQIAKISQQVVVPNEFIVPGDSKSGAVIDLARTIIRRAERRTAYLIHNNILQNIELLRYLNRLSSLCYALELLEIKTSGKNTPTLIK